MYRRKDDEFSFFFTSLTHILAKVSVHAQCFCRSGIYSLICTVLLVTQKSHQLDCKKKPRTYGLGNMHEETVDYEVTPGAHEHVGPQSGLGSGGSPSCVNVLGCGFMAWHQVA